MKKVALYAIYPLLFCSVFLFIYFGKTNNYTDPIEELRPRLVSEYSFKTKEWKEIFLEDYEESNRKFFSLLQKTLSDNYAVSLTLSAKYEGTVDDDKETDLLTYLQELIVHIEAIPSEKCVKLELVSETIREIRYIKSLIGLEGEPVALFEPVSDTVINYDKYETMTYYIDINEKSMDIYSPSENGYNKENYRDMDIVAAFSEMFFPEDISSWEGEGIFASYSSDYNLSVSKILDVNIYYRPFYLLRGKNPVKISEAYVSFSYSKWKDRIRIESYDTNYLGILYPLVTKKEFPRMYNGVDYSGGNMVLSVSNRIVSFTLPDNG